LTYHLGIDLGTTYTAAAVARDGRVEAVPLGHRAVSIPSVLYIRDDEFIVGEPANRRAPTEPDRVAREFKRRLGDPTPVLVGGAPLAPELLMARLLLWVVDQVSESEGGPPASITVTHPASWGVYKVDLLRAAVHHVGLGGTRFMPEPEAAATFYAAQRPLTMGSVIAVYDLGGGTFDAAVVRRTATGFEIIGRPEGIERLGGIDFDHAVFSHVLASIGETSERLDVDEPGMVAAVSQLREECVEAKEALSAETDVDIAVLLPGRQTEVRLTRTELEHMIRPAINETIVALRRALASAQVRPEDVTAVLLVGGSSRIPLVSQMVAADLGRPVVVDARPKDAIALGAALAGDQAAGGAPVQIPEAPTVPAGPGYAPPSPAPVPFAAPPSPAKPGQGRRLWIAAATAVLLLLGGFFAVRAFLDDPEDPIDGDETTTTADDGTDTTAGGEETIVTLPGDDWGPDAEGVFVDGCTSQTGSQGQDACQCMYDYVSENEDFDTYNQQDIEFQQGGPPPPIVNEAVTECVLASG
jgi:molecular chaperone DnaK